LVAEILSRYFPKEVEMHSFDTGISLVKKRDNWALLDKFLKVPSRPPMAPPLPCSALRAPTDSGGVLRSPTTRALATQPHVVVGRGERLLPGVVLRQHVSRPQEGSGV
jgi:hypothetical protein